MQIDITKTGDEAAKQALFTALDAFNDAASGRPEPLRRIALLRRDAAGTVIAGGWGEAYYDFLYVHQVFLPAAMRGGGLGTRLLRGLEATARAQGLHGLWLTTANFHAPAFYRKLGYREFGRQELARGMERFYFSTDRLAMTSDWEFEVALDPTEAERDAVGTALRAYGTAQVGRIEPEAFGLVVHDSKGAVIGGLWARVSAGWLFVELLFLPAELRRAGLGRRLMAMAEDAARARGCLGVYLDTFSFQARPFYARLGYSLFGQIDDYPPGGARYFLCKRLDGGVALAENAAATRTGSGT